MELFKKITPEVITEYRERLLNVTRLSPRSVNRKLSSLRAFCQWAKEKGYLEENPFLGSLSLKVKLQKEPLSSTTDYQILTTKYSPFPPLRLIQKTVRLADKVLEVLASFVGGFLRGPTPLSGVGPPKGIPKQFFAPISVKHFPTPKKILHHLRYTRPEWYKRYHSYAITHYFHWAILIIFCVALGAGIYQQFFARPPEKPVLALPTIPPRLLSFQGRLTDQNDNPIANPKSFTFRIFDSAGPGGTQLWTETKNITPDQDGIFNTLLGDTTGIDDAVFRDYSAIWLEVVVEAQALTPRQRIATVAYALNAEYLQGFPASTSAIASTVPVVNSSGNLVIAAASPTVQSTSGVFKIQGQSIFLQSDTNLGQIIITPNASLEIQSASPAAALRVNQQTSGDLLTASASAATKFTVDNSGNIKSVAGIDWRPLTDSTTALNIANAAGTDFVTFDTTNSRVGIGTTGPLDQLHLKSSGSNRIFVESTSASAFSGIRFKTPNREYFMGIDTGVDRFVFFDNTAVQTRWTISSAGNVGIGTTSPTSRLETSGAVTGKALVAFNETGDQNILVASASGTNVFQLARTGNITTSGDLAVNGGDITTTATTWNFDVGNTGDIYFRDGSNTLMQISDEDSIGNVFVSGGLSLFDTTVSDGYVEATGYCLGNGTNCITDWQTGGGLWANTNNVFHPRDAYASIVDLAIGGTSTSSAKFQVFGSGTNAGSATMSGQLTLNRSGTNYINSLGGQALSLRTSPSGDVGLTDRLYIANAGNVGIGTTNPTYKLDVAGASSLGSVTFTGTGLNDMSTGGTYNGAQTQTFRVQIQSTGTPNQFEWSIDNGSTWVQASVSITGSAQTLANGVTITFGATTGHTVGDYWTFTATPATGITNIAGTYKIGGSDILQVSGVNYLESTMGNIFVGIGAAGSGNNTGNYNTALGYNALYSNTNGRYNTAVGYEALYSNTGGSFAYANTAVGYGALRSNTTGSFLTAIGGDALNSNTTGHNNTAVGVNALAYTTGASGQWNTGLGAGIMQYNTTGAYNTAVGTYAFYYNLTGSYNTVLGNSADVGYRPGTGMTGTAVSGSGLNVGTYYYRVSFVCGSETNISSPTSGITTTTGNQQINLSSIPTYSGPMTCTARKIYRTKTADSGDQYTKSYYLVTTINDNTTTTYSDTTADTSLGAAYDGPDNMLALGASAKTMFTGQMVVGDISYKVTDSFWGSGIYGASPSDFTFNASGGSGTNNAGASLIFAGGKGAGSGAGGNLIFQTAPAGASGTSANSLAEVMRITSGLNMGIGSTNPSSRLETSGAVTGKALVALNETGDQNILVASASGTNVFALARTGNITTSGDLAVNGGDITTTATTWNFDVGGGGNIYFRDGSNTLMQIEDAGSIGDVFISGGLSLFDTTVTDGTVEATKFCTGDGETNCLTDFSSITNYWTRSAGVLSPLNTNDAIAATTSATRALTITQTGNFDVVRFEDEANDTTPFVIDSSGQVGIGTTAPLYALDIVGSSALWQSVYGTDDGLVGYWPFSEGTGTKAYDRSPYGNDGTLSGDTAWTTGKYGNALTFDGTDDMVETVNKVLFTTAFTMEAWFNATEWVSSADGGVTMDMLMSKWDRVSVPPDTDYGYTFGRQYGGTNFGIQINNGADGTNSKAALVATSTISAGAWHHAVATFQGGSFLRLYIDGVLVSENTTSMYAQVADAVNYAHRIGRFSHGYGNFYGKIDEPKIYNRAISADEVKAHYLRGTNDTAVAMSTTTTAGNLYGLRSVVTDTGVVTTGTDATYGSRIDVTRTGATGGTINTYGQYLNLVSDNAGAGGTHNAYGLYVNLDGNADNNYAGIFMGGNVGIGTTGPSNRLEVLSATTPQLRIAYDTSAYFTTAVAGTTGAVTFDTNGTIPSFTFSDAVTANTFSSSGVTITGGTITGTTIGATNPSTGAFTTLTSSGNTTLGTGASGAHTYSTGAGSTTTLGNSTGALTLASGGTSAWTNTSGNLTISTAASGILALTSAGALNLSAASASTWTLPSVANALNIDSNTLTIDASSNRVGIGTTSPLVSLEVAGAASASGTLTIAGATPTIDTVNKTDLTLGPSGGKVIIGGTSDLQINGNDILDSATNTRLTLGATVSVTGDLAVTGGDITGANSAAMDLGEATAGWITLTPDSGTNKGSVLVQANSGGNSLLMVDQLGSGDILTASASGSPKFVITNAGSVGIGTTNPNNTIQVANLINFDNSKFTTSLGTYAGSNNTGSGGTFVGYGASLNNTSGNYNTSFGQYTNYFGQLGSNNTAVGYSAAMGADASANAYADNSVFGYKAGYNFSVGAIGNVLIGYLAGDSISSGDYNIIIGYNEDVTTPTQSNFLNIGGAIYGDLSTGNVGIGNTAPAGRFVVSPPATETIVAAATITANGCGTVKQITAAGAVTTNTTDTFTAPAAANAGCIMTVVNIGANTITLDQNTNFKTRGGVNIALGAADSIIVSSNGTAWYQAAYEAAASDIAEWYFYSGQRPQAGDLVSISPGNIEIEKAYKPYDSRLSGIVSTQPEMVLGQKSDDSIVMALTGRVPAKVLIKNNQIQSGDPLTSSSLAGVGMKATQAGQIVGKALESTENWNEQNCPAVPSLEAIVWPEDDGTNPAKPCFRIPDPSDSSNQIYIGKIMVLVNLSWYDPDVFLTDTGDISIIPQQFNNLTMEQSASQSASESGEIAKLLNGYIVKNGIDNIITRVGVFAEVAVANLRAGLVETRELLADSVSATFGQFNNLTMKQSLVSPLISTNIISPLPYGDLVVDLLGSSPQATEAGRFLVKGKEGQEVASIDSLGNASFSGQLSAASLQLSGDASIAGELRAKKIIAEEIEGATLSANYITNITNIITNTSEESVPATSEVAPLSNAAGPSDGPLDDSSEVSATESADLSAEAQAEAEQQVAPVDIATSSFPLFREGLAALGTSSFYQLSVAGMFSQGVSFIIDNGNQIEVLSGDLYLQKLGMGGVNILDGKLVIDRNGNLTTEGDVTVKGTLSTGIISPLPEKDLVIHLGGVHSATSEVTPLSGGSSDGEKLIIQNASGAAVLTVNQEGNLEASGSGKFKELLAGGLKIIRQAVAENSKTELETNSTAGEAQIYAGETSMTIRTPYVTEKSLIYITPLSETENKVLYVARQIPAESFTVEINAPVERNIRFNWFVVN